MEHVQSGAIKTVVVAHKDRLARFAVLQNKVIEWIINQGRLIIQSSDNKCPEQELTEDLMAIVHVFSCRLNGKRGASGRKKRRLTQSSESSPPLQTCIDIYEQHVLMKRMMKDCRKTYNIALQYVIEKKWHHEKFLRSEEFNKHKMQTILQKLFVSEAGIGKHKKWHLLLRTPKVPRQQAVYSLVASLLTQRTKLEKRFMQKYSMLVC